MAFSYRPLWRMLAEKGINKTEFREKLGISTATLAKLSADKPVASDVLARVCEFFACKLSDVVEYVSSVEQFFINIGDDILGYEYSVYIDKWPECRIYLSKNQYDYISGMASIDIKALIVKAEYVANEKCFPNAGIIGTTKVKLDSSKQMIIINGSFAVTQEIMMWLIRNVS